MYKSLLIRMIKQIKIRRSMLITSFIIGLFFALIYVIFRSASNYPEPIYKKNLSSRAPACFEYVHGDKIGYDIREGDETSKVKKSIIENRVDRIISSLSNALIAYEIPQEIPYGEQKSATLNISPRAIREELETQFKSKNIDEVKIGERIRARLYGTRGNFTIVPDRYIENLVSFNGSTQWDWTLTPKNPGIEKVILVAQLIIKIDGTETYRDIKYFPKQDVEITASVFQKLEIFWSENWLPLVSLLFIPVIFASLYNIVKSKINNP